MEERLGKKTVMVRSDNEGRDKQWKRTNMETEDMTEGTRERTEKGLRKRYDKDECRRCMSGKMIMGKKKRN